MNLLSCFKITGSVEHISSVNISESGRSTASGRGYVRSGNMAVLRTSLALQRIRKWISSSTYPEEENAQIRFSGSLDYRGSTMSSSFYAQIM